MLFKNFKFIIILLLIFYQFPSYSKSTNNNEIDTKKLSNYFSGKVLYNIQRNTGALKFFKTSKSLINLHDPYLKQYIFSLIIENQINTAIKEIKNNLQKKNTEFFEVYLLLILDSIKNKDLSKSDKYLEELSKFKNKGTIELIIYESLKSYIYTFKNFKISEDKSNFGNLSLINKTFENCYIGSSLTETHFINLLNNNEIDYSRYMYFYLNYLIENNKFNEAKDISNEIEILNSSLLISQAKKWIDESKFENIKSNFSCKNENDILGEFFFLVSNLYSSQNDYEKSNFYINISNYLNPKFKFNFSLLAENHFLNKNYKRSEKVLNFFNKNDDLYYWYKIKNKAKIIAEEKSKKEAITFINSKFKLIKNPSNRILFDMANINKNFKEHKIAISFYDRILLNIKPNTTVYANILYRRGGSHERLGNFLKADQDLLDSLKIYPDDAYVLNYLAYSWLERNYNIDRAMKMLEKAYSQKKNDPFIIDSVGWAHYLVGDFVKAEKFLKRAIILMPNDPIVNDHYGDIMWKLNRKLEAQYYWSSVLNSKDAEDEIKENITLKLILGPQEL